MRLRPALRILGVALVLVGAIWILQSANLIQGSPMTGDPFWAGPGAGLVVIGAGLIILARRRG